MHTALNRDFVSVDDYLVGEEASETKHDYVGGSVYAMAGATKEHNLIALNIFNSIDLVLPVASVYEGASPG
jgi:Uma2 family endonuclease